MGYGLVVGLVLGIWRPELPAGMGVLALKAALPHLLACDHLMQYVSAVCIWVQYVYGCKMYLGVVRMRVQHVGNHMVHRMGAPIVPMRSRDPQPPESSIPSWPIPTTTGHTPTPAGPIPTCLNAIHVPLAECYEEAPPTRTHDIRGAHGACQKRTQSMSEDVRITRRACQRRTRNMSEASPHRWPRHPLTDGQEHTPHDPIND